MASVTTWVRLEPTIRRTHPARGLEARIHDPLWLLGRQWQLGAYEAGDGGSPVAVSVKASLEPIARFHAGPLPASGRAKGKRVDLRKVPLEALVEREARRTDGKGRPGTVLTTQDAAEAGLELLRHLDWAGLSKYRDVFTTAFPLQKRGADGDPNAGRFFDMLSGRVPDGADVARGMFPFEASAALPARLPNGLVIAAADWPALRAVLTAWLSGSRSLYSEPVDGAESAWVEDRLEYSFAVSTASARERTYVAEEYHGGRLEWYAFDRVADASLGASRSDAFHAPSERVARMVPSPLTFPGMPAARWWQFEDARVDFGAMESGGEDLLRMLFVDFTLIYGNDWFVVPLEVPVGVVARITRLEVTDAFGEIVTAPPTSQVESGTPWSIFRIDGDGPGLLVFPALGHGLAGEPIEEVRFFRDEMANLAWAVEAKVEGLDGRPVDRHESEHRGAVTPPDRPLAADAELRYRLQTSVPPHWIPLLPTATGNERMLALGEMLADPEDQHPTRRLGRILGRRGPFRIHDEEVPREGAIVTRAFQSVRWIDGSTHIWAGRQKQPGRGEGSSGLAFDAIKAGRKT